MTLCVDADITVARTLDTSFYSDHELYRRARERVFGRVWHWVGDLAELTRSPSLVPVTLLPGLLDEPLLLVRDAEGSLRCLSNVCTHRGNILIDRPCHDEQIRCAYHSRRFDLSGKMVFMPEFALARDFPAPSDHLPQVALTEWGNHGFVALDAAFPLEACIGDMAGRVAQLGMHRCTEDRASRREFVVAAHWALYVENYLEGLHIPFVHPGLNEVVDFSSYSSELFRYSNLQIAFAKPGEPAFDRAEGAHPGGAAVAAYYWWIFPNLMLNFYPWGLSVNLIEPQGIERTRVSFRAYVLDANRRNTGAGADLDSVEHEDERVVEAVQRGVRSRLYRGGRYSPSREQGVHHFHRLLCEFMA